MKVFECFGLMVYTILTGQIVSLLISGSLVFATESTSSSCKSNIKELILSFNYGTGITTMRGKTRSFFKILRIRRYDAKIPAEKEKLFLKNIYSRI